jgi:hypothetical protein
MVIHLHQDTIGRTIDVIDYGNNIIVRDHHVVCQSVRSGHCESRLSMAVRSNRLHSTPVTKTTHAGFIQL